MQILCIYKLKNNQKFLEKLYMYVVIHTCRFVIDTWFVCISMFMCVCAQIYTNHFNFKYQPIFQISKYVFPVSIRHHYIFSLDEYQKKVIEGDRKIQTSQHKQKKFNSLPSSRLSIKEIISIFKLQLQVALLMNFFKIFEKDISFLHTFMPKIVNKYMNYIYSFGVFVLSF